AATVESRTKELDSLEKKLRRKPDYETLSMIPDLAGIRIVVRYLSDIPKVTELVTGEFELLEISPHMYTSPEVFGYSSHHVVIRLKDPRCHLREWRAWEGLLCEVQVRTILQHAWASISHSLDYRHEEDMPAPVRRDLFKVAALLESGDDIF